MLESLGPFVPFGSQHAECNRHLVEDTVNSQEVDFSTLFDGINTQKTQTTQHDYKLYAVNDNPWRPLQNNPDEIPYPQASTRRDHVMNGGIDLEEELYIAGSTVIWSRGQHIVKSFKFEAEKQPVETALFAWFPFEVLQRSDSALLEAFSSFSTLDQREHENDNEPQVPMRRLSFSIVGTPIESSVQRKRKRSGGAAVDEGTLFAQDAGGRLELSNSQRDRAVLRKALCVVLRDTIKIYFMDGLSYSVHLPFPVHRAFPLDIGLFLERKRDPRLDSSMPSWQPMFISVNDLTEDAKAVTLSDDASYLHRTGKEGFFVESHDQHHELVFATAVSTDGIQGHGRSPHRNKSKAVIVVTRERKDNAHHIWLYTTTNDKQRSPLKETFIPAAQKRAEQSVKSSSFQTVKKPKRKQAKKNVRRIKITKQSLSLPPPSPVPSTPPPLTRKDSFAQFHEDFSSDTDQFYGSDAGDSFHESAEHSSLVLKRLWRETKSTTSAKGAMTTPSKAFVSHNRDADEIICIMNHQQRMLLGFNVKRLLSRHADPVEFQMTVKAAAPVCATRPFYDILVLKDNKLFLVMDDKMGRIDVPLPPSMQVKGGEIKELSDTVYNRFNLVLSRQRTLRCRLDYSLRSALVRDCLVALDCSLPNKLFSIFRERFLQSCFHHPAGASRASTEWKTFAVTLLAHLPLQANGTVPEKSSDEYTSQPLFGHLDRLNLPANLLSALHASGTTATYGDTVAGWGAQAMDQAKVHNYRGEWMQEIYAVIAGLHVVYEDYRLSKCKRYLSEKLGVFMLYLCDLASIPMWSTFYKLHGFQSVTPYPYVSLDDSKILAIPHELVDFENILLHPGPFGSINHKELHHVFNMATLEPSPGIGLHSFAQTLKMVWSLYREIEISDGTHWQSLVKKMVAEGHRRGDLESLNTAVAAPLLDALSSVRPNPPMHWPVEAYELLGRDDLAEQLQLPSVTMDPNSERFRLPVEKESKRPDMHQIMKDATKTEAGTATHDTDMLNLESEKLRFGYEGILETVRALLDSTRVPELVVPDRPDIGDNELSLEHQVHVKNVVQRTLSLSVGRGIFAFGTFKPDLTKSSAIEPITLSVRLLPLRTTVPLDDKALDTNYLEWSEFHSGVAAGLRISPSSRANSSWLLNNPDEFDPHHGGFLLALGLNGNIKKLPLVNWYRYMTQSCELATAGFILGVSVAYRGTKESNMTKLLSVHIPALLPPNSTSLSHSNLIQATCLMGLGLVYMGSCDRMMVSVILGELSKHAHSDPSAMDANFESCVLAAGFALGFIALGCGDESAGLADLQLRDKLYRLMTGQSLVAAKHPNKQSTSKSIHLDVTSPAATIALGLIYLKTENVRIAERVDVLDTRPYLNYVRPDFLLIRVVAKNLIMWNTIQPTDAWIDRQLPSFMRHEPQDDQDRTWDLEVSRQAAYNIVGGACLCIGLRYAGSKNTQAFRCLLTRLDFFIKLGNIQAATFQEQITKSAARTCVVVVATAAAMVMAGTGNLELLERLQVLHERIGPTTSYGHHMGVNMAMGLLFVGLGGYTLKTTNEAIAALLCAFYPFYPVSPDDNRYHLQAFRHMWALALDVRWLTPFDVDLKKPCRVPLVLTVYEDEGSTHSQSQSHSLSSLSSSSSSAQNHAVVRPTRVMRVVAPSVVPSYDLIQSIRVDSPRYLPLCINFETATKYAATIAQSGLLCVKRNDGCSTYDEDPHGCKTLFF